MSDNPDNKSCQLFDDEGHLVDLENPIAYDDLSRRDVRSLLMHILYAAHAHEYDISIEALIDNYNRGFNLSIPIDSELAHVAEAIVEKRDALDALYQPLLTNWRFDRIGVCTQIILRLALWELEYTETDPRIVINEAVELAKCFAEKDSYKFINGILDKFLKSSKLSA